MNLFQQREQHVGLIAEANGLTYETTGKKQASKGRDTIRRAFANDKILQKKKVVQLTRLLFHRRTSMFYRYVHRVVGS